MRKLIFIPLLLLVACNDPKPIDAGETRYKFANNLSNNEVIWDSNLFCYADNGRCIMRPSFITKNMRPLFITEQPTKITIAVDTHHISELPYPPDTKPYIIDAGGNCWAMDKSMRYQCPTVKVVDPQITDTSTIKNVSGYCDWICTPEGLCRDKYNRRCIAGPLPTTTLVEPLLNRDKFADLFSKSGYEKVECRMVKNDDGSDSSSCNFYLPQKGVSAKDADLLKNNKRKDQDDDYFDGH